MNAKLVKNGDVKCLDRCPQGLFESIGRLAVKTEFSDNRGAICYWANGDEFEPDLDPLDRGALLVQPMRVSL